MSGTSMDAIDTALVRFNHNSLELIAYQQFPFEEAIRQPVRELTMASPQAEIEKYHAILGDLFAGAVRKIISQAGISRNDVSAIGSHGQTIGHLPDAVPPRTLQIGDAALIARHTGITTVADFRRMDMEAGGQGAPLAPALHANLFRSAEFNRCILNLGGIANITVLPADVDRTVTGFDTGPGNGLLDDWNRLHNHTNMDTDSHWAMQGTPISALLDNMLMDAYFGRPFPKSTGRDYFNLQWLQHRLGELAVQANPADVQATLLQLTVTSIADAIKKQPVVISELYLCGGGMHNPALVRGLGEQLPGLTIASTQQLGLDPDAVEAVTFAWLAKRRLEGKPGNLPSVTGAREAVLLGTIYEPGKQ